MVTNNQFGQEKYQLWRELVIQVDVAESQEQQELKISQIAVLILRSRLLCQQF